MVRASWQERFAESPDVLKNPRAPADGCAGSGFRNRWGCLHHHGWAVLGRNRAQLICHRAPCAPCWRPRAAGRRLQTAHVSLCVSRSRTRRPEDAAIAPRGDRPCDCHRGDVGRRRASRRANMPTSCKSARAAWRTTRCSKRRRAPAARFLLKRGMVATLADLFARRRSFSRTAIPTSSSANAASAPSKRRRAIPSMSTPSRC